MKTIHLGKEDGLVWLSDTEQIKDDFFHGKVQSFLRTKQPASDIHSLYQLVCNRIKYTLNSYLSFNCFRQQLKHFYFANIDTSPSTTLAAH